MNAEFEFEVGALVEHRRYGYRGVVVGRDADCRADEDWYRSNLTQPSRTQPWYHVLVHGAQHSTYAAEDSLQPDDGGEQVVHPLSKRCFVHFHAGRYVPHEGLDYPHALPGQD